MTRTEKAAVVMATLDQLFPSPPITLDHRDPFTLLCATLLSAHSTDVCVNRVTPALFASADTPAAMAALEVAQIAAIIRPCGLAPRKAAALQALSRLLVTQHDGRVPADLAALEELPGVGHKTASVVVAQAFGQQAFPVDTHIHRLIWRWGLSDGSSVVRTERDCCRLFPPDRWRVLHLQLIHFGRQYCPARGHEPLQCPLCHRIGRRSLFAPARPSPRTPPKPAG
jgi:endonuclease-3